MEVANALRQVVVFNVMTLLSWLGYGTHQPGEGMQRCELRRRAAPSPCPRRRRRCVAVRAHLEQHLGVAHVPLQPDEVDVVDARLEEKRVQPQDARHRVGRHGGGGGGGCGG